MLMAYYNLAIFFKLLFFSVQVYLFYEQNKKGDIKLMGFIFVLT